MQEYPKHLYLNGDRNAADRVVNDKDEEDEARGEGFKMISEKPVKPAKKVETKEYTDGTSATGTAPLPSQSPDGAPEKAPRKKASK